MALIDTTATGTAPPSAAATPVTDPVPTSVAQVDAAWPSRIAASVRKRDSLMTSWRENIGFRVQAPYGVTVSKHLDLNAQPIVQNAGTEVTVPEDWSRTKQKTAQLMFQVPRVVALPLNTKA